METETREADDRELAINLAIYDFHEAIDRGEPPDPDAWIGRNPQIAEELQAYLDNLAGLDALLRPGLELDPDMTATMAKPAPEVPQPGPSDADLRPGDVLGDYVLLETLGEGGQGVVWKASPQKQRKIVVALKTLRGPALNDLAAVYRLREDADAIARMKHPNIIQTSYFGDDRGRWFFTMELMEGGTVADRLESYQSDPREAVILIEKIARAIHHAHTRNPGVLHLDLKPGNILLSTDGEPRVTDFGLSVRFETIQHSKEVPATEHPGGPANSEDASTTFANVGIVGTFPYMSPEMAGGRWSEVSTASDIYGLGAILYAMLAGRAPFRGGDARETLSLVLNGKLASPRDLNSKVNRELNAVCLKCLDRDPNQRYGSADALANDLRRWLERRPTLAGGKPSVAREFRFWGRKHPLGLSMACVAAVALWLAGLAVTVADRRAENARDAARLASQVDRELLLIRRAIRILAKDPKLRAAFASFPAPEQAGKRQAAVETFLRASVEGENLFGIAGGNPFINVMVMKPDGVLLADTLAASPSVGKDYSVRDYYRAFFENDWPRDYVYVARSFRSVKDKLYKIAVSTRIWSDRGELLGVLVANFTIGPRLIDVDVRQEPNAAAVLCPMDRSDPIRGVEDPNPSWAYLHVLDRRYSMNWKDEPFKADRSRLADFQSNPALVQAEGRLGGGQLVDYHRVGETHLVVESKRDYPWPLSWLADFR